MAAISVGWLHFLVKNVIYYPPSTVTKWGSGLRLDREVLRKVSESYNHEDNGKEGDMFLERTPRKKKTQRNRISYWSDKDDFMNSIKSWWKVVDILNW